MLLSLFSLSSHSIEIVNSPSSSTALHDAQPQLVSEFFNFSSTSCAGYDTPFSLLLLHRSRFSLEFADGGNTQIQASVGDDAPADVPTYIGVHGIAGELNAPYLHEILSPLIKENRGRGVVFNLRGCGDSLATSPAFHHGGSTSDLGAVVTWATSPWPKSKIYVIGTSLGRVITAKTLGQWGEEFPVSTAALVRPVYDFSTSGKAMETNFVSHTLFDPAVGAFYAKLVKKNKDAFDIDHWTHTRPNPFPPATLPTLPPLPFPQSTDSEFPRESRTDSFASSFSSTRATSIFSALPSRSTPASSFPSTPIPGASFCLSSSQPAPSIPVVIEHTPEIKDALAKALKNVTSRIFPQPLTKFCKNFVASTAHFLSGEEFMAETSAVNDLPNIQVPCLSINCADDPLMPGKDLPRSQVKKSPFVLMAVPKKGGHLGTFMTKKWKKLFGEKRYHRPWSRNGSKRTRLYLLESSTHLKGSSTAKSSGMAFRETTKMHLKLKDTHPTYPKSKST